MKKLLFLFSLLLFMGSPLCFTSCSDDEPIINQPTDEPTDEPVDEPVVKPVIKITVGAVTHNSMSFEYTTTNATACYALVKETVGVQLTDPSVVIEQGVSLLDGNAEGVYVAENLTPNTRYDIDFVAVNGEEVAHVSLSLSTIREPQSQAASDVASVDL